MHSHCLHVELQVQLAEVDCYWGIDELAVEWHHVLQGHRCEHNPILYLDIE